MTKPAGPPSDPAPRRGRVRLDLVETASLVALALLLGVFADRWFVARTPEVVTREYRRLLERYGRSHWSQGPEEWIVRDFFRDRRGGTFLDVGSGDPRRYSNTYYLEAALGWSGVAVDALHEYGPAYAEHRPRTRFFALFVGEKSDDLATLYVAERMADVSSASREFTTSYAETNIYAREVRTVTLNDLLAQVGTGTIDFLSMDIELSEPQALAGFDLQRYRPALICIEAHDTLAQWLLDYFSRGGYSLVARYVGVDPRNFWLQPIASGSGEDAPSTR